MECVACGKPISITAKFCGKCGAPVKRAEPEVKETAVVEETTALAPSTVASPIETASSPSHDNVEDLVLTIDMPSAGADTHPVLHIDLNLPSNPDPVDHHPAEFNTPSSVTASSAVPASASANESKAWLEGQEAIKKTLDKHSALLDFISLSAQQTPQPAAPDEWHEKFEALQAQQSQLGQQLESIKALIAHSAQAETPVRMPDDFKLLLEKQKIELLKAVTQIVSQHNAVFEASQKDTVAKIESLVASQAATAQAMEQHIAPMTQTVSDMRTRLQAVSKKIDEAATPKKTQRLSDDGADGNSGFILFVIGLLCGLTVILSSLAIYNFLSHETSSGAAGSHDAAASDHGKADEHAAPDAHDKPAEHDKPAAQDKPAAHDKAADHDKPAAHDKPAKESKH
jgi:hypothetical protein